MLPPTYHRTPPFCRASTHKFQKIYSMSDVGLGNRLYNLLLSLRGKFEVYSVDLALLFFVGLHHFFYLNANIR